MSTTAILFREYKKIILEHPDYHGKIYVNIDDTGWAEA